MKTAVLTRGLTYFLGNKLFEKGKAVPVTDKEVEWLKENAVDPIKVDRKTEFRQKFEFKDEVELSRPPRERSTRSKTSKSAKSK